MMAVCMYLRANECRLIRYSDENKMSDTIGKFKGNDRKRKIVKNVQKGTYSDDTSQ